MSDWSAPAEETGDEGGVRKRTHGDGRRNIQEGSGAVVAPGAGGELTILLHRSDEDARTVAAYVRILKAHVEILG